MMNMLNLCMFSEHLKDKSGADKVIVKNTWSDSKSGAAGQRALS